MRQEQQVTTAKVANRVLFDLDEIDAHVESRCIPAASRD
jgi:hypothetical protein